MNNPTPYQQMEGLTDSQWRRALEILQETDLSAHEAANQAKAEIPE